MTAGVGLLLFALGLGAAAVDQVRLVCQTELANLTVSEGTYRAVRAAPFGDRVYLYVPTIQSGMGGRYQPFELWVLEGVYGRPFVQDAGKLDTAAFDKIRKSRNVLATAIAVSGEKTPAAGRFRISKDTFLAEVRKVNVRFVGTDSVSVRVCR